MNISNIKPEHSDAHCHVQWCSWQRSTQKAQLDEHIQFPNSNMTTTELRKSNSNPVRDKESSNLASKLLSDAFKLITEGINRACHLKRNFREGILLIFFGMSEIVFIHKEIRLQRICEWFQMEENPQLLLTPPFPPPCPGAEVHPCFFTFWNVF